MGTDHLKKSAQIVNIFHNPVTAWVILGLSLCLTFVAYRISNKFVVERATDRFYFRTSEIEHAIEDRLRIYEQQLWSGVGFIYGSDYVSRAEWAKFVETMDIQKHWPGIQGFGYSVPVRPGDKQAHINAIRAEGFPEYTIKPEGERDMYSAIIYLEPFDWRNKRAFGYDMWSNDMRREAMARARDEGVAATSGIITLVQETEEDVQRGFLTYVPVYKTKYIPETLEERRSQFAGWVYAPYRATNLMEGVIGSEDTEIEFEIFDGESMSEESLLFDSNSSLHFNEKAHNPRFQKTIKVVNQGRTWTIYFNTPQDYLSGAEINQPRFVAIGGLIVDVLLFYVIFSIYYLQKRAMAMAKDMTKEINETKDSLEAKVSERTAELEQVKGDLEKQVDERTKELQQRMEQLESVNKAMVGREDRMAALKQENLSLKEELDSLKEGKG